MFSFSFWLVDKPVAGTALGAESIREDWLMLIGRADYRLPR